MNYFIVDGFNLAYRAHNVNFELKTSTGVFSGMFYGFVRIIFSLKKKYRGHKFVVVWDNKPRAKYELYPEYKTGRTPLPDSVASQIPDIREWLKNSGVDQHEMPCEEADDVIATLVTQLNAQGHQCLIYSNDKDLLQLVEQGKVIVYRPKVGPSPEKFFDEEAVKEQFGVEPRKLALYRSFDGDASDTLPGIERVPRKIIASLVSGNDDVEGVYRTVESSRLTEFQMKMFVEGKDRVTRNLKIMCLKRDLQGISRLEALYDVELLKGLLLKYEIKSINPDNVVELFKSSLNIKYSESVPTYRLETPSLFD